MKQRGSADLALMGGSVPTWLFERMTRLSLAMVEAILAEYGHRALLARMADPFWFQSFGAVIGMDWNSSGVTTTVMRALRNSINPHGNELGLYICGGKGKASMQTPVELKRVGDFTGLDGEALARTSKLVAKVDNTAVQDGHQLYLHSFLISTAGDWTVVQQGMNPSDQRARRYHWHSEDIQSFVEEPHSAVCGENQGDILNLTASAASSTRDGILDVAGESPDLMMKEIRKLAVPGKKGISSRDVDLKRIHSVLQLAQDIPTGQFEDLLLLKGLGPRTLQSLTLVSEVIHGTPARFSDPARFAFAHGSKGGNPFPVPTKAYDETIQTLRKAVDLAKMGQGDRQTAIKKLSSMAKSFERRQNADTDVEELLAKERRDAWKHGGRTMRGFSKPPGTEEGGQLRLF
ncbi:DUF763 domain-containing protein [Pontibacter sp. G13]|uniref:DUF763 domain-containing protein n=1 Tax=Pontibacter sp. G13 TaxID=3074898 RepID=UPI00288A1FF0|nr:DUF763 domain-containing protein [Pontibacter sp. G13]WNJ18787.1 DUF763 domain-containing protein [Pontibacter sp. G13]